jgi:hypothetical protein
MVGEKLQHRLLKGATLRHGEGGRVVFEGTPADLVAAARRARAISAS